jgi:hypothetical protein
MTRLALFPLFLIYELVTTNIVKSIFLAIALITLYFSYNVESEITTTNRVYAQFVDGKNHTNYVINSGNGYSVKEFNKPLKITNNTITYKEMSDIRFVLLLVFWIAVIFLIIAFFMGLGDNSGDVSWEFRDCWLNALSTLIVCELEDGQYYYMVLGRLVYKSDRLYDKYRSDKLIERFNIYGFRDLMNYPKFKTKTETRNSKLDKLGI